MFLCLLVSYFLFIRYLVIAVLCVVLRIAQLLLLLWPQFSTVFVFVFRANSVTFLSAIERIVY